MGTANRAGEYNDIINYSPFLLRGKQLLPIMIAEYCSTPAPLFVSVKYWESQSSGK
jgi:hypothetical protein